MHEEHLMHCLPTDDVVVVAAAVANVHDRKVYLMHLMRKMHYIFTDHLNDLNREIANMSIGIMLW